MQLLRESEQGNLGKQDYHNLNPIYRFATDYCNISDLPFYFKTDSGNFETAIVFNVENGDYRKSHPFEKWDDVRYPLVMICPDICSFESKIIIEFEEETGNQKSGAHYAKKGHGHEGDDPTKKDDRRNECYKKAGFELLQIWESRFKRSSIWKIVLTEFLINCWRKNLNDSMTAWKDIPDIE